MEEQTDAQVDIERAGRVASDLAGQAASHEARVAAEKAEEDAARAEAEARAASKQPPSQVVLAAEAQTVVVFDLRTLRHLVANGSAATVSQLDALIANAEAASAALLAALKA